MSNIYVSFGIHPHRAAEDTAQHRLGDLAVLACHQKCVAIGEVGIDYTTSCGCKTCRTPRQCQRKRDKNQEVVFLESLRLARRRNLPVILHCRDNGDGSAARRTLQIIQDEGFTDLKFHRHCFVGSLAELFQWQETLPNVLFGITASFMKRTGFSQQVIPRIPLRRLLVETDAPFLSPVSCCPVNHPWNLWRVVEAISVLKNVPVRFLLWFLTNNAEEFYLFHRDHDRRPSGLSSSR